MIKSIILWTLAILLAPFFSAVILKVKAFFGGKKGPPLLINYYTLIKLFKKGSVYSTSTTFLFKLGPMVSLCTAVTALMFLPIAGQQPVFSFNGDVIFVLCTCLGWDVFLQLSPPWTQHPHLKVWARPGKRISPSYAKRQCS